jgi:hypothetical protein
VFGIEPLEIPLVAALLQQATDEHRQRLTVVVLGKEPVDLGDPGQGDRLMIAGRVAMAQVETLDALSDSIRGLVPRVMSEVPKGDG